VSVIASYEPRVKEAEILHELVNWIPSCGTIFMEGPHMSRFTRLAPMLLALLGTACATGDDGINQTTFGGPGGDASAGDETGDTGEVEDESGDEPTPMTGSGGSADGTTGGGDDGGSPLCCEVGAQAGCDSATTEACVCTSQPSCCQAVWSQECVDLAIACEDPFCVDDPSESGSTGDSGGIELECDGAFAFNPPNPAPGVPFTATFTDPVGLTWVGMYADGPGGSIEGEWGGVGGSYTWSYGYDGLEAGVWTFVFTHRDTENGPDLNRGTCQKQF